MFVTSNFYYFSPIGSIHRAMSFNKIIKHAVLENSKTTVNIQGQ